MSIRFYILIRRLRNITKRKNRFKINVNIQFIELAINKINYSACNYLYNNRMELGMSGKLSKIAYKYFLSEIVNNNLITLTNKIIIKNENVQYVFFIMNRI